MSTKKRIEALEQRFDEWARARYRRNHFRCAAIYAIAHVLGNQQADEDILPAFLRGLEYETIEKFCSEVGAFIQHNAPFLHGRCLRAYRRLFAQCGVPYPEEGGDALYDAMIKISQTLPPERQDSILTATADAVLEERRTNALWRQIRQAFPESA